MDTTQNLFKLPPPTQHVFTQPLLDLAAGLRANEVNSANINAFMSTLRMLRDRDRDSRTQLNPVSRLRDAEDLDFDLIATMSRKIGWRPYRTALAEDLETSACTPIDDVQWDRLLLRMTVLNHAISSTMSGEAVPVVSQLAATSIEAASLPKPLLRSPSSEPTQEVQPVASESGITEDRRLELLATLRNGLGLLGPAERETADRLIAQADKPDNEWCAGCDAMLAAMALLVVARKP